MPAHYIDWADKIFALTGDPTITREDANKWLLINAEHYSYNALAKMLSVSKPTIYEKIRNLKRGRSS